MDEEKQNTMTVRFNRRCWDGVTDLLKEKREEPTDFDKFAMMECFWLSGFNDPAIKGVLIKGLMLDKLSTYKDLIERCPNLTAPDIVLTDLMLTKGGQVFYGTMPGPEKYNEIDPIGTVDVSFPL